MRRISRKFAHLNSCDLDIGTITILWSQPVSALQIMSPDGKWRWVRHIDNGLVRLCYSRLQDYKKANVNYFLQVVNVGDALEMLSGGFYKATIHRVIQPPADQRGYTRVGVYYFGMADDSVKLVPFTQSSVLQRVGVVRKIDDEQAPTMEGWRRGLTAAYGFAALKRKNDVVEEDVINGVVVKHYN